MRGDGDFCKGGRVGLTVTCWLSNWVWGVRFTVKLATSQLGSRQPLACVSYHVNWKRAKLWGMPAFTSRVEETELCTAWEGAVSGVPWSAKRTHQKEGIGVAKVPGAKSRTGGWGRGRVSELAPCGWRLGLEEQCWGRNGDRSYTVTGYSQQERWSRRAPGQSREGRASSEVGTPPPPLSPFSREQLARGEPDSSRTLYSAWQGRDSLTQPGLTGERIGPGPLP